MTKVLINGASGKMGQFIKRIIEENPSLGLQVSAQRDSGVMTGGDFDLVIDFSLPDGAKEAFDIAKQNKAAFLTGTTALPADFVNTLKQEKEIAVFYSPNVSIGVFLFTKLIKQAAALYEGYNKEMHEIHHAQKKDAPSGTAKSLAAAINFEQDKITYERTGTVPGTHILKLTSPSLDEEIILTHKALDRKLFAQSAVKVAAWLAKQKPGFYDMTDFTESLNK